MQPLQWWILGGTRDVCPHWSPNSFNFMEFLGKFGKIICWCPPGSWCPLLREILDPPLLCIFMQHYTYNHTPLNTLPTKTLFKSFKTDKSHFHKTTNLFKNNQNINTTCLLHIFILISFPLSLNLLKYT